MIPGRRNRPLAGLLAVALVLGVAQPVAAASPEDAIRATLVAQQGKRVTVRLQAEELTGKVVVLDDTTVKLGELAGKEFYDAVVRIDRIDAVVYRARDK